MTEYLLADSTFQVIQVDGFAEGFLDLALLEGIAQRRDTVQFDELRETGIESGDILRTSAA